MGELLRWLGQANQFVADHKEIVTVIAVPLLTWIVTSIVTGSAEKRTNAERKAERELRRALKISDFRRDWIENLRREFSNILSLDTLQEPYTKEDFYNFDSALNNILLLVNPNDEDFEPMMAEIRDLIRSKKDNKETNVVKLTFQMQRFLKKEWNRLVDETSDAAKT